MLDDSTPSPKTNGVEEEIKNIMTNHMTAMIAVVLKIVLIVTEKLKVVSVTYDYVINGIISHA